MEKRISVVIVLCLLFLSAGESAVADSGEQPSYISIHLSPALAFPLFESLDYYRFVGGGGVSVEFRLPFFPTLYLDGGLGYTFYSIRNAITAEQSLSVLSGKLGLGLQFGLFPWLDAKLYANGGYSYGFSNNTETPSSGGGSFLEGGLKLSFNFPPSFSIGLGLAYRYEFGLFQGLVASVGTGFALGAAPAARAAPGERPELLQETGEGLVLENLEFPNIFPVFHKYYDDHSVGTAVLTNRESDAATDIKLSLEIKPFMTAPKQCSVEALLEGGQSSQVDLFALFSEEKILEVTEGTKASAEITWEYTLNGRKRTGKTVETVRILNRNAMTWDDDRRAAAFVTALDPAVLAFSKNVSGMVRTTSGGAIDSKMLAAIALYEALCQYGMSYVVDPKSSYEDFSQSRTEIDFLQFPQQTLEYKAGDCDDLSILYCALFESVGIDTAFITVPGHIFMAFSLAMSPDNAEKSFQSPDDVIFEGEKAWIPIEVTSLDGKFLEAWQLGAKEWREGYSAGTAGLYPIHEAWQTYEPVGLAGGTFKATVPAKDAVVAAFQRETARFAEHEIYPEIARLQAEIKKNQNSVSSMNKLGVLYAKYNMLDQAEKEFQSILAKQEYAPALINLGNISYLNKDIKKATTYYERAYKKAPDDAKVIVCLARAYHEVENYGLVAELYDKLKSLDSDLARQFAYLGMRGSESTKAADASGAREVMIWGEE